jgi:hypothetical protein
MLIVVMGRGMLSFLNKYAGNVHSQNGEDGITQECVRRIGIPRAAGHVVEIGANDGYWMSNARFWVEWGWSAKLVESDWNLYLQCKENWRNFVYVYCQCSHVDGRNVNAFVKDNCDLLSLDTDGGDYDIFNGLQAKPKIVIMEIDSSIPPNQQGFNSDGGASYWTGVELGLQKGYFLLCHTGNLIFVDEKYRHLFPEIEGHPLIDYEKYFNRAWLREAA